MLIIIIQLVFSVCCLSVADFLQRLLQRKRLLNWSPCVCVCVLRVLVCSDVVIIIVVFPQSVAAVLVCSLSISFTPHIEFYYRKLYYYYVLHSLFFMFSLGLVFFLFQAFLLLLHTGFIFLMQIFMITPRWWCSFIRFLPTSVLMPKYAKFFKNCSEEHGRPDCVLHLKGVFINVHFLVIRLDCFLLRVGQNIEFSACFTIRKLRVRKINSKGIQSHENFFTMVITLEITHFIMLIKTLNFQAHELASTKHFKHNHWLTGCNWSSTKAPLSVLTLKKVISCFPLQIEVTCVLYLFSQHIWTDELIGSGSSISARKWPI